MSHLQGKRALAREFVSPAQPHEQVNRPVLGMGIILGAVMIGALVLSRRPDDSLVPWTIGVVGALGALGGAAYHPINRYWPQGLVAGAIVALGALITTYYYIDFRARYSDWIASAEFLIPAFVGALPGIGLYIQLMRDEVVSDDA